MMDGEDAFTMVLDRLIAAERDHEKTRGERDIAQSQVRDRDASISDLLDRVPPPFDMQEHLRLLRDMSAALQTTESAPLVALNRRILTAIAAMDPEP